MKSFALITTEANAMMKKVHVNLKRPDQGGRMPVILHPKDYFEWLDSNKTIAEVQAILQPFEEEKMQAYTVSKLLTQRKVNPNQPAVMQFMAYPELGEEVAFNVDIGV